MISASDVNLQMNKSAIETRSRWWCFHYVNLQKEIRI